MSSFDANSNVHIDVNIDDRAFSGPNTLSLWKSRNNAKISLKKKSSLTLFVFIIDLYNMPLRRRELGPTFV